MNVSKEVSKKRININLLATWEEMLYHRDNKLFEGGKWFMSDSYVECLVKAKASGTAKFFKVLLIALTVIFAVSTLLFGMLGFLVAVILGIGAYFVNLYSDLEYEYLYLDKEISVDKVMAKSKRKRVATYSVDRMEILAPVRSYHLDGFRNRKVKKRDYSIGVELQPDLRYAMYYEGGEVILLSPSPEFVSAVKNVAPRKVFTD